MKNSIDFEQNQSEISKRKNHIKTMTQNINVEAREKLRHSYKEQYRFQAKSFRDLR